MTRFVSRCPFREEVWLIPSSRISERSLQNLMNTRALAQRALCAGVLAAGLVACGGSHADRPDRGRVAATSPTSPTTSAPSTSSPASNLQGAVIDAYLAYWRVVNTYGAEAAPFDPTDFMNRFSPVATGAQYDTLFNVFQLDRAKGWVYRGREGNQLRPRVTELSGDRAVIEDCADDFGGIFDTKKNVFVEPLTPGQHTRITAVLRIVDGTWKVDTQGGGDERCTV